MTLRDGVRAFRFPFLPKLPEIPNVAHVAQRIAQQYDSESKPLLPLDREALIQKIKAVLITGQWEEISFRELKWLVWICLNGEKPLAEEPGFLESFFTRLRTRQRRSTYHGLILAYLRDFDPAKGYIHQVAQELEAIVNQFDWPWAIRHQQYKLFFPQEAASHMATACLTQPTTPVTTLVSIGMGEGRLSCGLAAYTYLQAVEIVRKILTEQNGDPSLIDIILDWSLDNNGKMRYSMHRNKLVEALLLPWQNLVPTDTLKKKILSFILQHFKDPRLSIHAKEWLGVKEEAIAVLRKWLTSVALDQFFVVVDQVAMERMWSFRKTFWLAYFQADLISDAWVLFGPKAQVYARQAFGKIVSYGFLEKSGIDQNHSVLLLKINKLTVAEWSHNGKCHIWVDGNPKAPKLYLGRYRRHDLVQYSDNQGQVHSGSENGRWQRQIEAFIRNNTGISLSERNYMPTTRSYEWQK
ncbi:MAG: EH signature domain-containing protein [Magnetococcus sp. DMHC-6]